MVEEPCHGVGIMYVVKALREAVNKRVHIA